MKKYLLSVKNNFKSTKDDPNNFSYMTDAEFAAVDQNDPS
jgi:hypothetical protein